MSYSPHVAIAFVYGCVVRRSTGMDLFVVDTKEAVLDLVDIPTPMEWERVLSVSILWLPTKQFVVCENYVRTVQLLYYSAPCEKWLIIVSTQYCTISLFFAPACFTFVKARAYFSEGNYTHCCLLQEFVDEPHVKSMKLLPYCSYMQANLLKIVFPSEGKKRSEDNDNLIPQSSPTKNLFSLIMKRK
ncbi:hypothetical protein EDD16DRAFT_572586 [Pisolithus croceorrhizus]|nr:hypothetical protein EDD16DRAFT_572586 [Pisolithus croceorrhizus]